MTDLIERAALTAQPGASDANREEWLAERRTGVTATEVRDLYLGKISIRELVDRKLGRTPEVGDLSGVPVIGWGKYREPFIAAIAFERYGIRPESRVFHAADEWRFLASPDGLGEDFDGNTVIDELKTAGKNIARGTEAFDAKGYYVQMVWGMRVMRAVRCLYGWEYRLDATDGFEPGLLQFEWIEWDATAQKLAVELEVLARKFLAALDVAAAVADWEHPEIDEELDTLAVNYLRGLDLEKQAKDLKEPAYKSMFERLDAGEPVLQLSPLARVSFTPATYEEKPVLELDQVRAKAAASVGLYERLEQAEDDLRQAQDALDRERLAVDAHEAQFVVQVRTERVVVKKATLRVTAAKIEETKK